MFIRIVIGLLLCGLAQAQPRAASEALDSLGVVTHLDYLSTPYADVARVEEALRHVGIRNLRDMTPRTHRAPYERLAARGYRFNFVIRSEAVNELQTTLQELERFQARFPGSLLSLEGLNEIKIWPANYRGQVGFAAGIAVQRDLYRLAKRSRALAKLPVLALTLGGASSADHVRLGDLSDSADLGNAHVYFGARPPWASWRFAIDLAHQSTSRLSRGAVTETGYSSSPRAEQGLPEDIQAKYLLMLIAEAWREQIPFLYLYQLVDDRDDAADWSRSLGLFRHDWLSKPAADAVGHLTSALRADARVAGDAPGFTLQGDDALTRSLPLRRADGALVLVVWRQTALWDEHLRQVLPVKAHGFTLVTTATRVSLVDSLTGERRELSAATPGFRFEVLDRPVILILQPQST